MTSLGLNSATAPAAGTAAEGKVSALMQLRQSVVMGGGLIGGGTLVFAVLDLMKSEPDKAFKLLQAWGPWFFLAFFCAWAGNSVVQSVLRMAERATDRFADSMDKIADKQDRLATAQEDLAVSAKVQADAAKQAAEKDDRESERLSTLVEYAGQNSLQALQQGKENNAMLAKILARLDEK